MKTIITLFISICLITISTVSAAAPPTRDVNVVNTPDVNVVNMPPIEANITGPIEATITDPVEVIVNEMPGVMIDNGPSNPVPVTLDAAPRIPYHASTTFNIPFNSTNQIINLVLPDEGLLVIEQVSLAVSQATDSKPFAWNLRTVIGGQFAEHSLNLPTPGASLLSTNITTWQSNENVRLYADLTAFNRIIFDYHRRPTGQEANGTISISGYIIPSNSASLAP